MAQVFEEHFATGTVDSQVNLASTAYTVSWGALPTYVDSPIDNDLAAKFDGSAGFGYLRAEFTSTTARTFSRYVQFDNGTHTTGNSQIISVFNGSTSLGQVTLRSNGTFGIRSGNILQSSTEYLMEPDKLYRLVWKVNDTAQSLEVRDGLTDVLIEAISASIEGGGFSAVSDGWVGSPNGTICMIMDRCVDHDIITNIPAYISPESPDILVQWNGDDAQSLPKSTNPAGLSTVSTGPRPPALRADNSAGTRTLAYWDVGIQTTGTARVYFKTPTAWGSTATKIVDFNSSTWDIAAGFVVAGSGNPGQVRLYKVAGANVVNYDNVVELDTWYRAELMIDQPNSRARVYIYEGDSTTPILDPGWVNDDFGVGYDRVTVGIDKGSPPEQPWHFDDIIYSYELDLIGPVLARLSLLESFEDGADGNDISTSLTMFTGSITGVPAKFSSSHSVDGDLAMRCTTSNSTSAQRVTLDDHQSRVWISFYLYIHQSTSIDNAMICGWDGSNTVGSIRLMMSNSLRLEDGGGGGTARWTSTPLDPGQWHRVSIYSEPGSATGHRLKIYSGANLHGTTPSQDSGDLTATVSSQSYVGTVRFGVMVVADTDHSFDYIQIDNFEEPAPYAPAYFFAEDFEDGSDGTDLTTANTEFDYISPAAPTFVDDGIDGSLALRSNQASSYALAEFTERSTIYVRSYIKMAASSSWSNFYPLTLILGATQVASVQIYTAGSMIMRDASGNIGTFSPQGLVSNTRYTRLEWEVTPTTQRLRVFTGVNLHGIEPTWDSGVISWTPIGQLDGIQVGNTVSVSGVDVRIDDFALGDSWIGPSREVAPRLTMLENFESGTHQANINSGVTIFNTFSGTNSTFSTSPLVEGALSMRTTTASAISVNGIDLQTDQTQLYMTFYLYIHPGSSTNTTILQWRNSSDEVVIVGGIQLWSTGELRIRDATTMRWESTALATGEWHRVAAYVEPGSVTGHRLKIYSGANLHGTTPSQDSGDQTATIAGQTAVNQIRFGATENATVDLSFDYLQIDNLQEPGPYLPRIKALENFEAGTDQADVSTATTLFNAAFGTASKFSAETSIDNGLAMRSTVTSQNSIYTYTLAQDKAQLWISFYLYVHDRPADDTTIAEWRDSEDDVIGSVRLMAAGELRLADAFTTRWVAETLDTDQWHRVAVYIEPDSNNYQLKIYSGDNLHSTTLSQDSGPQPLTLAGGLLIQDVSFGIHNTTTADISLDYIQIDDLEEPAPYAVWPLKWSGDGLLAGALTTTSAGSGDTAFDTIEGSKLNIINTSSRLPQIALSQMPERRAAFGWSLTTPQTEGAFRFYWTSPRSWPDQSFTIARVFNGTVEVPLTINVRTNGTFRVLGVGGLEIASSSSGTVQLSTRYRVECRFDCDPASGMVEAVLYEGESLVSVAAIAGGGDTGEQFDRVMFGNASISPTVGAQYYDDLALSNQMVFIGPVGTEVDPGEGSLGIFSYLMEPESFESGVSGQSLSTDNTNFDWLTSARPTFSTDAMNGSLAMRVNSSNSYAQYVLLVPETTIYVRGYVKMFGSSAQTYIFSLIGSSTLRASVRLSSDGRLRLRSNSAEIGNDSPIGTISTGSYARVEWEVTPTTQRLKVFTGSNLHGSEPDWDSGEATWTAPGNFDHVHIGNTVSVSGVDLLFDDVAVGDNWIGPSVIAAPIRYIGGASEVAYNTTVTVNYKSLPGSTLLLHTTAFNGNTSVTDTAGNTWTLAADTRSAGATGQRAGQLYYCINALPITSVTATQASNSHYVAAVSEWSGVGSFRAVEYGLKSGGEVPVEAEPGDLVIGSYHLYESGRFPNPALDDHNGLAPTIRETNIMGRAYTIAEESGDHDLVWDSKSNTGLINASFIPDSLSSSVIAYWNGNDSQPLPDISTGGVTIVSEGPRAPAMQIDAAGQTRAVAYWTVGTNTRGTIRTYVKTASSWTGSATTVMEFTTGMATSLARFTLGGSGQSGQVRIVKVGGVTAFSQNNVLEIDTWYRAELMVDQYNDRARLYLYKGDSTAVLVDSGWVNDDFGDSYDTVRVGMGSDAGSQPYLIDDVIATNDLQLIGPAGTVWPAMGIPNVTVWDGFSRLPATLRGVWDGTQILPAKIYRENEAPSLITHFDFEDQVMGQAVAPQSPWTIAGGGSMTTSTGAAHGYRSGLVDGAGGNRFLSYADDRDTPLVMDMYFRIHDMGTSGSDQAAMMSINYSGGGVIANWIINHNMTVTLSGLGSANSTEALQLDTVYRAAWLVSDSSLELRIYEAEMTTPIITLTESTDSYDLHTTLQFGLVYGSGEVIVEIDTIRLAADWMEPLG